MTNEELSGYGSLKIEQTIIKTQSLIFTARSGFLLPKTKLTRVFFSVTVLVEVGAGYHTVNVLSHLIWDKNF